MSAESILQSYLSQLPTITALCPANRIVTGDVQSDSFPVPYLTLHCDEQKGPEANTLTSRDGTLYLDIYTGTLSAGKAIADGLRTVLHNQAMSQAGEKLDPVRMESQTYLQEPDGTYHFNQQYEFRIQVSQD